MPKKSFIILIAVFAVIIASGCTKPDCADSDYETFQVILDSPVDGSTLPYGEDITFDWHHDETCEPFRYLLRIYDPIEDRELDWPTGDNTSEFTTNFNILAPFLNAVAGREYHWSVLPAGESWGKLQGDEILRLAFTYGKICEPGELVPPQPTEPENGSWVGLVSQSKKSIHLDWSIQVENCVPEEFEYQVASDPGFNHIVLTGKQKFPFKFDSIPVPTCTHLYWRVRSVVGNSSSVWSESSSFYYAYDNTCWFVGSPGDGSLIKGYVFKDKCDHTNPLIPLGEDILPPCVTSQYGVHADGAPEIMNNSEPGTSNIRVDLGSGPCPSTGLDEIYTNNDGLYYFTPQEPGDYCVSVSKIENSKLEDGIWTLPLTDQVVAEQTITIGPGDNEIHQHFGWDKNDFAKLNFSIQKLSTCRQTDNKNSAVIMYLEEGAVIPVVATNAEKTWFLTRFNCFVSTATGEAEEGDLPLYPKQPLPVIDGQAEPGDPPAPGAEQKPCSSYTTGPRGCPSPRCVWIYPIAGPGYCTESD